MTLPAVFLAFLAAAAAAAASPPPSAAERAAARVRAGDYDAAIEIAEEALAGAPGDAELWRVAGQAYGGKARTASVLAQIGLARKCRAAFERAVELAPRDVEARVALFTYYLEAPRIAGGGRARAREEAEAIVPLDAARGHSALGALLVREKDLAGAAAEYRRALDADPKSADARAGLGAVLIEEGRFEEARREWLDLASDADLGPIAHFQLGTIARLSGTGLDDGIEHVKRYLEAPPPPEAPTRADAEWTLAMLYEKAGRRAEAVDALREALRSDPGHAASKKDLKRLGE